jgi:hypothetical protein
MELEERLVNIEKKLDYIIKQEKHILDLMVKFIDHVEEIEAIAVKSNVMKN